MLGRIESAIGGLAMDPDKHPAASESNQFTLDLQELRFGLRNSKTHRVVFAIRGNTVRIYAVRHLAQDFLTQEDIETIE